MSRVMEKFYKTHAWNLPVIDKNNHYIGLVSNRQSFLLTAVNWYFKQKINWTGSKSGSYSDLYYQDIKIL
jgi:hypothetical protein